MSHKKEKIAIYPGSFDPVTNGHMDIIERAAGLFGNVIVLASINPLKPHFFTTDERREFLLRCTKGLAVVTVDSHSGLLVDYFREHDADVIIKGLRAVSDFEYEFQMAMMNKKLCNTAETVFLTAASEHTFLSSSAVRQAAMFGGDISSFVPAEVVSDIKNKFRK